MNLKPLLDWSDLLAFTVFFGALPVGLRCSSPRSGGPLRLVCTTTMITDLVKRLAPADAEVVGLMGPGVDPHLYKATASDVSRLTKADMIFYNGLHLEGKMTEVLESMQKSGKPVVAISQRIPKEKLQFPAQFQGHPDPHVWFDVELWSTSIRPVSEALAKLDAAHADDYRARAQKLTEEMASLDQWCKVELAKVPEPRKVVVTSHDAFNYFGQAYGFEVVGLQGISTVTEAGLSDVTKLVDFIKERKIPAIFVESSVPREAIERVSEDSGARVGGELFSDAMGSAGTPEGTYDGMIRHNVRVVVEALQ